MKKICTFYLLMEIHYPDVVKKAFRLEKIQVQKASLSFYTFTVLISSSYHTSVLIATAHMATPYRVQVSV